MWLRILKFIEILSYLYLVRKVYGKETEVPTAGLEDDVRRDTVHDSNRSTRSHRASDPSTEEIRDKNSSEDG